MPQTPAVHTPWPPAYAGVHTLPHAPQFWALVLRSVHALVPGQRVRPEGQATQLLAAQYCVFVQVRPHVPQLAGS